MALRQLIEQQPALGTALYGDQPLPMIFQYDPLNTYVENGEDQQLLFTLNRLENLSPRINGAFRLGLRPSRVRFANRDVAPPRYSAGIDALVRD